MQEGKWVLDKTELEVRATSKLGTQTNHGIVFCKNIVRLERFILDIWPPDSAFVESHRIPDIQLLILPLSGRIVAIEITKKIERQTIKT